MRILILGGGVVGACTAFFLARRGVNVTVVERNAIAGAASGKSGGFLARDWCDGTPVMPLARRSFALHTQLADELGGDAWGYRPVAAYSGTVGGTRIRRGSGLGWVGRDVAIAGQIGSTRTTAQIHPRAFTEAMMRAAQGHGAELLPGEVTGLPRRGDDVVGVQLREGTLAGDAVVIAIGPWSLLAAQ